VRVELYSDHEGGEVFAMERDGPLAGVYNGFSYFAAVPNDQPPEHYTPRIVPSHPDATVPMEAPRIRWRRP
jgi:starch phosphorylase